MWFNILGSIASVFAQAFVKLLVGIGLYMKGRSDQALKDKLTTAEKIGEINEKLFNDEARRNSIDASNTDRVRTRKDSEW